MRRLFKLPNHITIDYKRHDNSGFAGHRTRRNSSVGSEGDGGAMGTSVGSGGSGGGLGGKWRSRRIMQQKARGSEEPAAEPAPTAAIPAWMTANPRERSARGGRGEPHHERGSGDAREAGAGWGTRGAGFDRSRREGGGSGWGERGGRPAAAGDSGGRGEAAAAGGGGGSTFWRHAAAAADTNGGGRGGFADGARRGGGSAWRSDNRWRDADAANLGAPAGLGDAPPS